MGAITVFQPLPGGGISSALLFPVQPITGSDCTPAMTVTSSIVDKRRNNDPASTNSIDSYGITPWQETGPEFVYAFVPSTSGKVNTFLTGVSKNLNLFLLDGSSGICNSSEVIAYGKKDLSFTAQAGQTYYLVVDGYLGAKSLYTLTIDDNVPAPEDNVQLLNNRPLFNWEDTPGANRYLLQISTNPNFNSLLSSRSLVTSIWQATNDLPKDHTLYWRVIPKFGKQKGLASEIRTLQTANPPSTLKAISPKNNSLQRTLHPRLDWNNAIIALGKTFGYYEVELSTDFTFLNVVAREQVAGAASNSEITLATELNQNTRYYWRVRAYTADGHYSNWSGTSYFRTVLLAPIPIKPADQGYVSGLLPTFSWLPVEGASSYTLQVSTVPNFSRLMFSKTQTGTSFTTANNLSSGRTYYWRIRTNGRNGPSQWSEVRTFTTH